MSNRTYFSRIIEFGLKKVTVELHLGQKQMMKNGFLVHLVCFLIQFKLVTLLQNILSQLSQKKTRKVL